MSVCCDKFTVYLCFGEVVCAGVCRFDATICSWFYAKSANFYELLGEKYFILFF